MFAKKLQLESDRLKNAIIIGSTSGIGLALGKRLLSNGWRVGFTGRRVARLDEVVAKHPDMAFAEVIDVTVPNKTNPPIEALIKKMGGCDLFIISAGVGHLNPVLETDLELATVDTNVIGFIRVALCAMKVFLAQGHGHLLIISSIAANRGDGVAPAYGATKAFQSVYAQALRKKVAQSDADIVVTDIQPGFVDTDMAKGEMFWVQPVEKAAMQIEEAINRRRSKAYVTKRWRFIAWIMRNLPDAIWHKL